MRHHQIVRLDASALNNQSYVQQLVQMQIDMAQETEHRQLHRDTVTKGVQTLLQYKEFGFYLAAVQDDRIVGMCAVTYEWSDWRAGLFWWIQSVYVVPESRRNRVFTDLFNALKNEAKQAEFPCCGIRLYMEKDNERARATYEKLGLHTTDYQLLETDWVL